jgi:hypothetical protein
MKFFWPLESQLLFVWRSLFLRSRQSEFFEKKILLGILTKRDSSENSRWDFTVLGGVLFAAAIILLLFGILTIFIKGKIMSIIYASLGALIFSVYLIYDTQLMVS